MPPTPAQVAAVAGFPRRELSGERRASVAVAVVPHGDGSALLMTVRAAGMRAHAGQFALPGGRRDPGESEVDTALRETHEELGIDPGSWTVHGLLDDVRTTSGTIITPVVITAERPVTIAPNVDEVAEVVVLPLPEASPPLTWIVPGQQPLSAYASASGPAAQSVLLGPHYIFAPTGAIVHQFLELWLDGRVTRIDTIGEPDFVANPTS